MKVALTGGAGFVGSAIARALVAVRHDVHAIDDLSTGKAENLQDTPVNLYPKDAGNFDYNGFDAIVHAAALPDVKGNWETEEAREHQWQRNTELTRQILDRAPYGVRFVFISTCSVYGAGEVDERSVLRATSPYAASKIAAEALVQAYTEAKRVNGSILRLVNVVGPNYAHGHLADFVAMAKGPEKKIRALDDGVKRKTFVHADDVAMCVLHYLHRGSLYPPVMNAVSEVDWSWRDSVEVMRAMVAHDPSRAFTVECENRPSGWIGDPDVLKVKTVTGEVGKRSIAGGVAEALISLGWLEP